MGLIRPNGPDWAYCSHNLPSTPNGTAVGTSVTAGTGNADGTAVTMLTALAHDVELLSLRLTATAPGAQNNDTLVNVLIDPAGGTSWSTLIPWLIAGGLSDSAIAGGPVPGISGGYDFPIWIPAGASLGLQARSAGAGTAPVVKAAAFAHGGNANPASWWCGQRVTDIGINSAASTGQAHTSGNSGAFSTWANLGSALAADCGALQFAANGEGDNSWLALQYEFQLGVDSVQIGPPLFRVTTTAEVGWWCPTGPIFKRLAAGTQLMIRGKCSGTPTAGLGVAAWAVH